MDKEDVVRGYNGILLNNEKEWNWVISRDMDDLETVIHSEVSQKEKNKYHILMHICEIWKNWYKWSYLRSSNRDTDIENEGTDIKGEDGVGRTGSWDWHIYTAAAAAAKSLQSCPTLCDPRDDSPPGSPIPGILQARTLEWVAISFSNAWKWKVKLKSLSRAWLLATPWTAAYQAPPSMGFSRQQY